MPQPSSPSFERLSPDRLYVVSNIRGTGDVRFDDNGGRRLLHWDEQLMPTPAHVFMKLGTHEGYDAHVKSITALNTVIDAHLTSDHDLRMGVGFANLLAEFCRDIDLDPDQMTAVNSIREAIRQNRLEKVQGKADSLTTAIGDTGMKLWAVAQAPGDIKQGVGLAGRYVGVAVVNTDESLRLEPVVLARNGKNRQGLFPQGYQPLVRPVFSS